MLAAASAETTPQPTREDVPCWIRVCDTNGIKPKRPCRGTSIALT